MLSSSALVAVSLLSSLLLTASESGCGFSSQDPCECEANYYGDGLHDATEFQAAPYSLPASDYVAAFEWIADITGDGQDDVIASYSFNSGLYVSFLEGDADMGFLLNPSAAKVPGTPSLTGYEMLSILCVDGTLPGRTSSVVCFLAEPSQGMIKIGIWDRDTSSASFQFMMDGYASFGSSLAYLGGNLVVFGAPSYGSPCLLFCNVRSDSLVCEDENNFFYPEGWGPGFGTAMAAVLVGETQLLIVTQPPILIVYSVNESNELTLESALTGSEMLGSALRAIGDIWDDGVPDLIVGNNEDDTFCSDCGGLTEYSVMAGEAGFTLEVGRYYSLSSLVSLGANMKLGRALSGIWAAEFGWGYGFYATSTLDDYYFEINENLACTRCPENSVSSAGAVDVSECECDTGYASADGPENCEQVVLYDECNQGVHNCYIDATCVDGDLSFTCNCQSGYFGDGVTYCSSCPPHSYSDAGSADVSDCTCDVDYVGNGESGCTYFDECEQSVHNCAIEVGTCTKVLGSFTCSCTDDYYGDGVDCQACLPHSTSPSNSSSAMDCVCDDDYTGNGVDGCLHVCENGLLDGDEYEVDCGGRCGYNLVITKLIDVVRREDIVDTFSIDWTGEWRISHERTADCRDEATDVSWHLFSSTGDQLLHEHTSGYAEFVVSPRVYGIGSYTLRVKGTIADESSEEVSVGVNVVSCVSVNITGTNLMIDGTFFTSSQLQLSALGQSTCVDGSGITYTWLESSGHVSLEQSGSRLVVASYALSVETSYLFTVRACITDSEDCAEDSVRVRTVKSDIVVQLAGGSRTQGRYEEILLNGASSYDPDAPNRYDHLNVTWSCIFLNSLNNDPCYEAQLREASEDKKLDPRIPIGEVVPGEFEFFLSMEDLDGGRTAWASVLVTVVDLDLPQAFIGAASSLTIPASSKLSLTGKAINNAPSTLKTTWSLTCVSEDCPSETIDLTDPDVVSSEPNSLYLVIRPSVLTPNFRYTLTLTVEDTMTASLPAESLPKASVSLYAADVPYGGSFEVSPPSGVAFGYFDFRAEGWQHQTDALVYRFAYRPVGGDEDSEVALTGDQSNPVVSLSLPEPRGNVTRATWVAMCYVSTSQGATAPVQTFNVTVMRNQDIGDYHSETYSEDVTDYCGSVVDSELEFLARQDHIETYWSMLDDVSDILDAAPLSETDVQNSTLLAQRQALRAEVASALLQTHEYAARMGYQAVSFHQQAASIQLATAVPGELTPDVADSILSVSSRLLDEAERQSDTAVMGEGVYPSHAQKKLVSALRNLLVTESAPQSQRDTILSHLQRSTWAVLAGYLPGEEAVSASSSSSSSSLPPASSAATSAATSPIVMGRPSQEAERGLYQTRRGGFVSRSSALATTPETFSGSTASSQIKSVSAVARRDIINGTRLAGEPLATPEGTSVELAESIWADMQLADNTTGVDVQLLTVPGDTLPSVSATDVVVFSLRPTGDTGVEGRAVEALSSPALLDIAVDLTAIPSYDFWVPEGEGGGSGRGSGEGSGQGSGGDEPQATGATLNATYIEILESEGLHMMCRYWNGSDWAEEGVQTMPNPHPADVQLRWRNSSVSALCNLWEVAEVHRFGCVDVLWHTVDDRPMRRFQPIAGSTTESCMLLNATLGCAWNETVQAFEGDLCVWENTVQCASMHLSTFSGVATRRDQYVYIPSPSDTQSFEDLDRAFAPALIIAALGVIAFNAIAYSVYLESNRRDYKLQKLHSKACGFQQRGPRLTWEYGRPLARAIGIPYEDLSAALPTILDNAPNTHVETYLEERYPDWQTFVGTGLVLAYLSLTSLHPPVWIVRHVEAYSRGLSAEGRTRFAAFVEDVKLLLYQYFYQSNHWQWASRSRIWRLRFFQRSDGSWDSLEVVDVALRPPGLEHTTLEITQALPMPPHLRLHPLGERVWSTAVCYVFVKQQPEYLRIPSDETVKTRDLRAGKRNLRPAPGEYIRMQRKAKRWLKQETNFTRDAVMDVIRDAEDAYSAWVDQGRVVFRSQITLGSLWNDFTKIYLREHRILRIIKHHTWDPMSRADYLLMLLTQIAGVMLASIMIYYTEARRCCLYMKKELGYEETVTYTSTEDNPSCGALRNSEYADELGCEDDGLVFASRSSVLRVAVVVFIVVIPLKMLLPRIFRALGRADVETDRWRSKNIVYRFGRLLIRPYRNWRRQAKINEEGWGTITSKKNLKKRRKPKPDPDDEIEMLPTQGRSDSTPSSDGYEDVYAETPGYSPFAADELESEKSFKTRRRAFHRAIMRHMAAGIVLLMYFIFTTLIAWYGTLLYNLEKGDEGNKLTITFCLGLLLQLAFSSVEHTFIGCGKAVAFLLLPTFPLLSRKSKSRVVLQAKQHPAQVEGELPLSSLAKREGVAPDALTTYAVPTGSLRSDKGSKGRDSSDGSSGYELPFAPGKANPFGGTPNSFFSKQQRKVKEIFRQSWKGSTDAKEKFIPPQQQAFV
eukprot:Rmarinus@m.12229